MLRFELEKKLLSGELAVRNLPDAWNAAMDLHRERASRRQAVERYAGLLGKEAMCEVESAESEHIGLVNRAVPDDDLMPLAREWALEIAANAPLAIRAMKRLFRHGQTQDFESHSHHVLLQTMLLFGTKDFQEGLVSFMEKRPPEFRGR